MRRGLRGSFQAPSLATEVAGIHDLDVDLLGVTSIGGGDSMRGPYTGTKALMLAVLDNGIACYFSRTPRIRAEAECWVTSNRQHSPFAFIVVCETLGLEPEAVRTALRRMRLRNSEPVRAIGRRRPNVRREGRLLITKAS